MLAVVFCVSACAAVAPHTPRERLLAAEQGYQAAVDGLAAATRDGIIKSGSVLDQNLKRAAITVNGSLDQASALLTAGKELEALEYIQIAEGGVAELTLHWNAVKRR